MITGNVVGILYSQIGYDFGQPVRVLVRGGIGTLPPRGATFAVGDKAGPVTFWGSLWGSDWWVADVTNVISAPGEYVVYIADETGREYGRTAPFSVYRSLLFDKTCQWVGVEQGERRRRFARNGSGWFDAGMEWQEACSHSAYLVGFLDLLEYAQSSFSSEERVRIEAQIRNGADYLAALQDKAELLPGGTGGVVHQIWKYDELIIPGDVSKAALVWARAAHLLSPAHDEKRSEYRTRATCAMSYLRNTAKPLGAWNLSLVAHGAPDGFVAPDEWMTRDLLMHTWAAVELGFKDEAAALADHVLRRQIPETEARDGLYGHFRTWDSAPIAEKAWIHNNIGADTGGHFPHYVLPLLQMSERWHDHPDAVRWRDSVRDFAYGYFLPACQSNPFLLLPLGQFDGAGLIYFAGSWHGLNAAYALAAVLALEFERVFADPAFSDVAVGNMQWIAGLNAGLTQESLGGCHMFSTDLEPGIALPVSMIHGIGARDAGCWLNIRGAITNGFSAGDQFHFDVAPRKENDAPSTMTDEDWITHAGGWLSALARLRSRHDRKDA